MYVSVSRTFPIVFFCHWYLIPYSVPWFRFLIRDSIFYGWHLRHKKCALVYRKNLFRWSSNYVFIAKEIRQTRALQVYVIKETTGNIQRLDLLEATRCRLKHVSLCKLTCETIFMIDIDEMLPKLLHRLKYASIYLNKIQNVLTKQQGSTV